MKRLVLIALLAGCAETVDPEGLPSVADFDQWHQVELRGEVPFHGDGCRWVWVNDVGRAYGHAGKYKPGTVFVKQIWEHGECGDGDADYTSVMRRIAWEDPVAEGLPLQDEWLFTDIVGEPGDAEEHYEYCWLRCHRAAPWNGAWYDYGAP